MPTFRWCCESVPVQAIITLNESPLQASTGPPSAHSPSVEILLAGGQSVVLLNATWMAWYDSRPVHVHQYFGVTVSPIYGFQR